MTVDFIPVICVIIIWLTLTFALFLLYLGGWIMKVSKTPKNLLKESNGLRLYQCNRFQKFLFGRRYAVVVPGKVLPYLTTDYLWAANCCFEELESDIAAGRCL